MTEPTDLLARLRNLNPWTDMRWPDVCRNAADLLASVTAERDAIAAEAYEEGYGEGNRISKSVEGELWRSLTRWGVANGQIIEDHPDGYTPDDMMQAVRDREDRLTRRAESAEAELTRLREALSRYQDYANNVMTAIETDGSLRGSDAVWFVEHGRELLGKDQRVVGTMRHSPTEARR